jgi:hypothetical protein
LSTGAIDTTIWNAITTSSPGIAPTFLKDYSFYGTAPASIRTLVGHD